MKSLLIVTAALEGPTGLALLVVPAVVISVLLGSALDAPRALVVGRVAGVALLALSTACWLARKDADSGAARGLITGMLLYNIGVAAVLVYAALGVGLCGIGLWPAVVAHAGLAIWCVACLRGRRA